MLTHGSSSNGARALCSRLRGASGLTTNFRGEDSIATFTTKLLRSSNGTASSFGQCLLANGHGQKRIIRTGRNTFVISSYTTSFPSSTTDVVATRMLRLTVTGRRNRLPSYLSTYKKATCFEGLANRGGGTRRCRCRRMLDRISSLGLSVGAGFTGDITRAGELLRAISSYNVSPHGAEGSHDFFLNLCTGCVCSQLMSTSQISTTGFATRRPCASRAPG